MSDIDAARLCSGGAGVAAAYRAMVLIGMAKHAQRIQRYHRHVLAQRGVVPRALPFGRTKI
jgi:hypothetical protein